MAYVEFARGRRGDYGNLDGAFGVRAETTDWQFKLRMAHLGVAWGPRRTTAIQMAQYGGVRAGSKWDYGYFYGACGFFARGLRGSTAI